MSNTTHKSPAHQKLHDHIVKRGVKPETAKKVADAANAEQVDELMRQIFGVGADGAGADQRL